MKRLLLGGFGVILVFLFSAPIASARSTGSTAVCVHRWTDSIAPGLTLTRTSAAFTSHGESGTIACTGRVRGHQITGAGTFGEVGQFVGTCVSGSGSAVFSFTIPTTAGLERFSFPVTFRYLAGAGSTASTVFPGAFVVVPTAGDCVLAPVTRIAVVRLGILRT